MNMHRCFALLALAWAVTCTADDTDRMGVTRIDVQGTGVHRFSTAIIHGSRPTESGFVQWSTDLVEIEGDLTGRILYHPTSVFDFVNQTLVNTGHQVFSGTVAGSAPVLLHDDDFRFEVNLATGATIGRVLLVNHLAGPRTWCVLDVVGTGLDAQGDALFAYEGQCRLNPSREDHD